MTTERSSKTQSPRTGLFALFLSLFAARGTGAPKSAEGMVTRTGEGFGSRAAYFVGIAAVACLVFPGVASAVAPEAPTLELASKTATEASLRGVVAETCPNVKPRSEQPYGLTLPDCRAYEMVSPLDKGGAGVIEQHARAAVSGGALAYGSFGSFAEPLATKSIDTYIARRGAGGWASQNITPPYEPEGTSTEEAFSDQWFTPDLSQGLFSDREGGRYPLAAGAPAGIAEVYLADTAAGSYQLVSTVHDPLEQPYVLAEGHDLYVDGASTDLSRVVFSQAAALTPGAAEGAEGKALNVYAWAKGSSELHLVNVPPEGKSFGEYGGSSGGASTGAPGLEGEVRHADVWRAVSADGSRVFFTAFEYPGPNEETGFGQVYLRENPSSAVEDCAVAGDSCTVEVSASQRTEPDVHGVNKYGGPRNARYWGASTEGSRVFFTSDVELTNNAQTGPEDNAPNLYEYDVETKQLTDLTVDEFTANKTGDTDGAAVLGLVTASEDGTYVYFVAEGDLALGATADEPNLYLSHAGHVSFIATLAPANEHAEGGGEFGGDSLDWFGEKPEPEESGTERGGQASYDVGPGSHAVRVTPDGRTLVFSSRLSLTGYDSEQAAPGECEGTETGNRGQDNDKCSQVYVYDAASGKLACASCDSSGARPVGDARLGPDQEGQSYFGTLPYYEPRNLSEDGGRLFFETPDPLVSRDTDGASGCPRVYAEGHACQDVYEWELPASVGEAEAGVNSCTSSSPDFSVAAGGCVFPVSDVAGDNNSFFLDASPDGSDVFIATADQLVPSDTDQAIDVYDARVGGGFPVAAVAPVCDNADSCKAPVSPQPGVFAPTGSATFSGPGNPPPPPAPPAAVVKPMKKTVKCSKGKKLSRNKCVKVKHEKQSKVKKSAHTNRRAR
jgi:WD40-like Beta Propeller Repeat